VILQDTCMDATGSLLVYATIDSQEINTVMKGGDSSCVTLFSNGITIVPDCFQDFSTTNNYNVISGKMNNGFDGGSLVTISFQMMGNIFPKLFLWSWSKKLMHSSHTQFIRSRVLLNASDIWRLSTIHWYVMCFESLLSFLIWIIILLDCTILSLSKKIILIFDSLLLIWFCFTLMFLISSQLYNNLSEN